MNEEEIYYWIKIFQKYQQSFRSADNKEISFCKILKTLDQQQTNWNKLKKMIEDSIEAINELVDNPNDEAHTIMKGTFGRVLNMMQELEGKSE